jgi:hypothetical protein
LDPEGVKLGMLAGIAYMAADTLRCLLPEFSIDKGLATSAEKMGRHRDASPFEGVTDTLISNWNRAAAALACIGTADLPGARQHRSTQRHPPKDDADEQRLTANIVALAKDYGGYGYRAASMRCRVVPAGRSA